MFYGVPISEVDNLRNAVLSIARIYNNEIYVSDMLITLQRNLTFRADQRFVEAFKSCASSEKEQSLEWRLHVLAWAASHALHIEGDFVECGVLRGFSSAVVCKYLDFAAIPRSFYLYDTFGPMPMETSTEEERANVTPGYAKDPAGWLAFVRQVFAPYPNAKVVQGAIPFIFAEVVPEKIAYLHVDLNSVKAELLALEHLYDRVTPGGIIIFDDYGWRAYRAQTAAESEFMRQRGVKILELPTGQGMVVKPPDPVKGLTRPNL